MSTINGYVARDKDGTLGFCYYKPHRENEIEQTWWGSCDADFDIWNETLEEPFKDLTWEDEPVEVTLSLVPVNDPKSNLKMKDYIDYLENNSNEDLIKCTY